MSDDHRKFAERIGTQVNAGFDVMATKHGFAVPTPSGYPATAGPQFAIDTTRWGQNDDTYFAAPTTTERMPPGLYRTSFDERRGPILVKQKHDTDNLIEMPDDASRSILDEFRRFWKLEPEFRKRGFLHKRGYLMWGPPGGGKTSLIAQLSRRLIEDLHGIVVFIEDPGLGAACLELIRKIEPKRPIVAIFEDIDALISRYGEPGYLALLDGEHQVDSVVNVATTNYPERMDPRFVDRPSRFDTIQFVGMPSDIARRAYFKHREPGLSDAETDKFVRLSDGYSIAHLKEMIIATKCFGQDIEDVVERMEAMRYREAKSDNDGRRKSAGFIPNGRALQ